MCWNAYYRGEAKIDRVRVRDPKGPLRILDTVYAKRDDREIPIALIPDARDRERADGGVPNALQESVRRTSPIQAAA